MTDFQWSQIKFEERWFHVLAFLLSRKRQQQDPGSIVDPGLESLPPFEEQEEDSFQSADTKPRNIAKEEGKKRLLEKFLDRLAEVIARKIHDGDDVCATGILEFKDHAKIYVAKNAGIDSDDLRMMRLLQTWLRFVAIRGVRPDFKIDKMWKELVDWCKPRLLWYRDTLTTIFGGTKIIWPAPKTQIESKLQLVRDFCTNRSSPVNPSQEEWSEIISVCYELRYESQLQSYLEDCYKKGGIPGKASSLYKALAYLGRLRTAYETCIEFAMHFPFVRTIFIEETLVSSNNHLAPFKIAELSSRLTSSGIDVNKLIFKDRGKVIKQKARKLELINESLRGGAVRVHAEIQVLTKLLGSRAQDRSVLGEANYIGCSKKSCFLCFQLLHGFYQVRGSHEQIWPRWIVPPMPNLARYASLKLHARISNIGDYMLQQLIGEKKPPLQMKAHSTPAVTEVSSSKLSRRNRRQLDVERSRNDEPKQSAALPPKLGAIQQEVVALLLPADGSEMKLVTLPIRLVLKTYDSKDHFLSKVPDFQKFWPDALNFDRGFHTWNAENQESVKQGHGILNGLYIAYYNRSEELSPNEYLKAAIQIDEISFHRKFWNGDIFVIKRGTQRIKSTLKSILGEGSDDEEQEVDFDDEGAAIYEDIPEQILQSDLILSIFKNIWENDQLESELVQDQEGSQYLSQHEINKDLILARMTKTERHILSLLPNGFLELLAMETGDYGAMSGHSISRDPSNPDMIRLGSFAEPSVLEKMDWQGFSSEQL